jgi:hypothetical protein
MAHDFGRWLQEKEAGRLVEDQIAGNLLTFVGSAPTAKDEPPTKDETFAKDGPLTKDESITKDKPPTKDEPIAEES